MINYVANKLQQFESLCQCLERKLISIKSYFIVQFKNFIMQLLPSPDLRPFIKHYLFINSTETLTKVFRIFSDGNTGVVFSLQTKLYSEDQDELPRTFVYGQILDYKTLITSGAVSLCIVVFYPFGMNSLLGIRGTLLKNILVDSQEIFGSDVNYLQEQLQVLKSREDMINLLNHFFSSQKPFNSTLYPMVSSATQWMLTRKGLFTAKELLDYTGWQQRSLERAFNDVVGLSPKKLGGIIRLHHFLGEVRKININEDLTPLVYDSGYYDQAHLIRQFKQITGITPTVYQKICSPLVVNLVLFADENIQLHD